MASLDNLLIVGIRGNSETEFGDLQEGKPHYYLNIWRSRQPYEPQIIPVPFRGGYFGGFTHLAQVDQYLLVADGEGILAYDLTDLSKGYAEFGGVDEVSSLICKTSNYLVSCLDNLIQIRSLDDMAAHLQRTGFANQQLDIPFRQTQHQGEGDTALSIVPIVDSQQDFALLNNAGYESYLIEPNLGSVQKVEAPSKEGFPYTFQRREQFHLIPTEPSKYLVFTEATSGEQRPNRVYSFDIRGPPTIAEAEPLELDGKQIVSMLPSNNDHLTILTNYSDLSHLETLDPSSRRILNSKHLSRKYDLGDRLQNVGDDLLIVRHLQNEIVDAESEAYIKLTGAENDVPIPEISSTWDVPQYFYVTRHPRCAKEKKRKKKRNMRTLT